VAEQADAADLKSAGPIRVVRVRAPPSAHKKGAVKAPFHLRDPALSGLASGLAFTTSTDGTWDPGLHVTYSAAMARALTKIAVAPAGPGHLTAKCR
jgi:hypothetical protein